MRRFFSTKLDHRPRNFCDVLRDNDLEPVQAVFIEKIGDCLDWSGSTSTRESYYHANGRRVAMRVGNNRSFLLGDHPSTMLRTGPSTTF